MKGREPMEVYWQGPSVGWDFGGNASRVFTSTATCWTIPATIFQRFPGVEGSAYFIGGLGVNYQRANDIILAPIRAGVGFRLGANVGYLAYSKKRNYIPFYGNAATRRTSVRTLAEPTGRAHVIERLQARMYW